MMLVLRQIRGRQQPEGCGIWERCSPG